MLLRGRQQLAQHEQALGRSSVCLQQQFSATRRVVVRAAAAAWICC
jgi:hypothetical protein